MAKKSWQKSNSFFLLSKDKQTNKNDWVIGHHPSIHPFIHSSLDSTLIDFFCFVLLYWKLFYFSCRCCWKPKSKLKTTSKKILEKQNGKLKKLIDRKVQKKTTKASFGHDDLPPLRKTRWTNWKNRIKREKFLKMWNISTKKKTTRHVTIVSFHFAKRERIWWKNPIAFW